MENPHEERQSLLLERIIKNVDLLNDALIELDRSVAEINEHNQAITIVGELWEGYRRNAAFNLQNMEMNEDQSQGQGGMAQRN
ncbi:DASH complex, subunit Dad4 [Violaceomyces palustris]|uniref:DASH complex, subunit Dad4 n=1 Tax=Violaceomyces palustris TaxID=1673888 RepID=A0ACD0P2J0_9BASI|nr:DASH complex, subunit Dad4 [Violaceomyces palustris]